MINQWMRVLLPQISGNPRRQMRKIDKNWHGILLLDRCQTVLFFPIFYVTSVASIPRGI
jgi:hypothetical protein